MKTEESFWVVYRIQKNKPKFVSFFQNPKLPTQYMTDYW